MNTPSPLNADPRLNYIANCELSDCSHSLAEHVAATPMALDDEQPAPVAQGAVVASSLLAFTEGTSTQNRQDVMDSFLFATLVANKAFNPETESPLWYGKFNEVLSRLGWLSSQWRYARYQAQGQRLSMDQVGLEIIASALAAAALPGPASVAMLKVATDAVQALRAKDEPLRLFERQSRTHQGGHFRMASCSESGDGLVNVVMGAVSFKANTEVRDVLFWEWGSADVETYRGEDSLVLNSRLYAQHRELVQEKLAAGSRQAIAEFDI
ncbi:hypothetical protein RRX38_19100 [Pseudomonas sp. DTU_2021_1001937_2_SI_NGA_ILE_001]|uniref:hypothetical protein n=1 Tax=Pseudomonas sp. DTU_2021_1001937_2_SI_NGA_ILE_001 TaxID=3077589 RepID=UPI0028FC1167|nr:hypothetical protein [Pseudomonas sp. DTU_2021_1001937_2_SI_NGA_ILE_001]WNW13174.1 hypothetical protein RRX38_19100 [Pseudomonas sp. DTU_2021_1001937_2_SI_NGA_ILE_001]